MGLDITFEMAKRHRVNETKDRMEELRNELSKLEDVDDISKFDKDKYKEVSDEYERLSPWNVVATFRKVNFLLPFFGYEENLSRIEIDKCQIEDLIDKCNEVLRKKSLAETLLPTEGGFFFGSTDYDEYYFDDVKEVRNKFMSILKKLDKDDYVLTMTCWW